MQPTLANRISKLEEAEANRPMTDAEYAENDRLCRELVRQLMDSLCKRGWSPENARAELIANGVREDHFVFEADTKTDQLEGETP